MYNVHAANINAAITRLVLPDDLFLKRKTRPQKRVTYKGVSNEINLTMINLLAGLKYKI